MALISAPEDTRLHWQERREGSPMPFLGGRGCDHNCPENDVATLMDDPWLATYWFTAYELL